MILTLICYKIILLLKFHWTFQIVFEGSTRPWKFFTVSFKLWIEIWKPKAKPKFIKLSGILMMLVLGESKKKMCNSKEYYRSMAANITQYNIT